MSYHVIEGDPFSSGCGVSLCHSGLGDCPLLEWGIFSHPQWCQLLCTAMSSLCPSGSHGARGTPTAHFPADTSRLLSLEGRGGYADSLGLSDIYCCCTSTSPPPVQGPAIISVSAQPGCDPPRCDSSGTVLCLWSDLWVVVS